jgi:phage tail tube protein FII
MANPLDSTYKEVYEQRKAQLKQAKIDQANYEQEVKMTSRELERENALLGIKRETLAQLSGLQESGALTPTQQAKTQLEEVEKIQKRIAEKSNNKAELETAKQAVEQAKLNYSIAQRAMALEDANLITQKISLEDIQNIQKERKVDAIDLAQIEQDAAERQLDDIVAQGGTRQQIAAAQNNLTQKQIALEAVQNSTEAEFAAIDAKERSITKINELQKTGGLNAISTSKIQLDIANKAVETAKKYGTEVEQANAKAAARQAEANLNAAKMGMQQRQIDVSQSLSEQVAGSVRTFPNGRPRPLSETERLARQAAKARQQARDAVLTGAPGEAAYQQQRALGLETSVADRLSFGSSGMQQRITPDSSSIAAEITTSNQLLEAIKNSLTPTVN